MNREEIIEVLNEYKDGNSREDLIKLLKEKLVEELEIYDASSDRKKHDLNMIIRDLEEELHFVETDKLDEFDPEDYS